jgi:hypothetical protein
MTVHGLDVKNEDLRFGPIRIRRDAAFLAQWPHLGTTSWYYGAAYGSGKVGLVDYKWDFVEAVSDEVLATLTFDGPPIGYPSDSYLACLL